VSVCRHVQAWCVLTNTLFAHTQILVAAREVRRRKWKSLQSVWPQCDSPHNRPSSYLTLTSTLVYATNLQCSSFRPYKPLATNIQCSSFSSLQQCASLMSYKFSMLCSLPYFSLSVFLRCSRSSFVTAIEGSPFTISSRVGSGQRWARWLSSTHSWRRAYSPC
jgi:hypothetical protein